MNENALVAFVSVLGLLCSLVGIASWHLLQETERFKKQLERQHNIVTEYLRETRHELDNLQRQQHLIQSVEFHPNPTADMEEIKKSIEEYSNGIQRYLTTQGVEAKPVTAVDPLSANVYADWLEENGEASAAMKLRKAFPITVDEISTNITYPTESEKENV